MSVFLILSVSVNNVHAQSPKTITGNYVNSDYGIQFSLPAEWSGSELIQPDNTLSLSINAESDVGGITITAAKSSEELSGGGSITGCNNGGHGTLTINGKSFSFNQVDCGDMQSEFYLAYENGIQYRINDVFPPGTSANFDKFDSFVKTITVGTASSQTASDQSSQKVDATTPEFPAVSSLVLMLSMIAITSFALISKKSMFKIK
ncbi:MAG: hypothetical protein HY222_06160 [Thaumarchaeota archaeon]|nr:hypothetical protein [Nitrososphaerota archaeon]MBI3641960.1 hypothetical protein [Nitrososphaerota archaeon]